MEKRTIGPVVIEWSENLLTVRWFVMYYSTLWLCATILTCFSSMLAFDALKLHHWLPAATNSIFTIFGLSLILTSRVWRERLIFDAVSNCIRDLQTENGLFGTLMQTEYGPLETIAVQSYRNEKQFGVALRGADDKAIEPPMLTRFKKQEQAQEVADILNAFLRQPAPTEMPGVWPPPPRRAERAADPPVWKRAGKKNDDATH